MTEEAAPFLAALDGCEPVSALPDNYRGPTRFHRGIFADAPAVVVTMGIGTTNAALAATVALAELGADRVIVAGTCGGLSVGLAAGDVVVADRAIYHEANATGFGYAAGQIPQMPADYVADEELVALASNQGAKAASSGALPGGTRVHSGLIGSSNSFVTSDNAAQVRDAFADLLAVDMETTAIAQVCWMFGVPWVSTRAVSDLCDPDASQAAASGFDQFRAHAPEACANSFAVAHALAGALA